MKMHPAKVWEADGEDEDHNGYKESPPGGRRGAGGGEPCYCSCSLQRGWCRYNTLGLQSFPDGHDQQPWDTIGVFQHLLDFSQGPLDLLDSVSQALSETALPPCHRELRLVMTILIERSTQFKERSNQCIGPYGRSVDLW